MNEQQQPPPRDIFMESRSRIKRVLSRPMEYDMKGILFQVPPEVAIASTENETEERRLAGQYARGAMRDLTRNLREALGLDPAGDPHGPVRVQRFMNSELRIHVNGEVWARWHGLKRSPAVTLRAGAGDRVLVMAGLAVVFTPEEWGAGE